MLFPLKIVKFHLKIPSKKKIKFAHKIAENCFTMFKKMK